MKRHIFIFVLACVSFSTSTFAGNELPNGGQTQAIWFNGTRPAVNYCVKFNQNFGVPRDVALEQISRATDIWQKYLSEHVLFDPSFMQKHALKLEDVVTTKFQLQVECTKETDLVFYLGDIPDELKATNATLGGSIALTHLRARDPKGWGTGLVWLASQATIDPTLKLPLWEVTRPNGEKLYHFLLGTLLHEIGHLFGFQHVSQTIMSEDIKAHMLRSSKSGGNENPDLSRFFRLMQNIDHEQGLLVSSKILENTTGFFTNDLPKVYDAIKELTGKNIVPESWFMTLLVPNLLKIADEGQNGEATFWLTVNTSEGEFKTTYPIKIFGGSWAGNEIIKTQKVIHNGNDLGLPPQGPRSGVLYGVISSNGKKHRVNILINQAQGTPYTVLFINPEKRLVAPIFRAERPMEGEVEEPEF
ncbi:MAG: hypothetical protein AB7T49_15595 [Oligoflexales bacterium]